MSDEPEKPDYVPQPIDKTKKPRSAWSTMSEDRKARINEALKRAGLKEVIE